MAFRAVLDTNVVLAADRASTPQSPNREIINRWAAGEFIWLITDDIAPEYTEKLLEKGIDPIEVEAMVLRILAERPSVNDGLWPLVFSPLAPPAKPTLPTRKLRQRRPLEPSSSPLEPPPKVASSLSVNDGPSRCAFAPLRETLWLASHLLSIPLILSEPCF